MNALDHNLHLGTRHGSWPAEIDGRFGRPSLGLIATLGPWLRRGIETVELWARRRRDRDALLRLDDYLLRDIGLNRYEAEGEWRKPSGAPDAPALSPRRPSMSNRLDQEFPQAHWQAVPPIGPDGVQLYLERGRQLRAEAFAYGLRRAARALIATLRAVTRFVRYASYGIAKRPPEGTYATTAPGRLTGHCG